MRLFIILVAVCCFSQRGNAQCAATITPLGNTTFCQGDSVKLVGSPGDTYQWYLNGAAISGANGDTLTVLAGGSYEVETDSNGCVSTSLPVVVTVNTVPAQPGAISGNTSICSDAVETYSVNPVPGATSYTWQKYSYFGNLNTTTTVPTLTGQIGASALGTASDAFLRVRANNSCGSSSEDTLHIQTYTPVWAYGTNQNLDITDYQGAYCPVYSGQPTMLYANWHPDPGGYSTATSYQWYRNGNIIPGGTGQWLAIDRGGNYSVNIYCGVCPSTLVKNPLPQCAPRMNIYPQSPVNICIGSNVTLNVDFDVDGYTGSGYTWSWTLNGSNIAGTNGAYSITPSGPGNYNVSLQSAACSTIGGPVNCNMLSYPSPIAVTFSNFVAPTVSVTQNGNVLTATAGFNIYQWYRNGVPIPGATTDTYTIVTPGNYTVVVNDGNMCTGMYRMGLGIENISETNFDLVVYPNPGFGLLNISANIPREDKAVLIVITDIAGREIIRREFKVRNGTMEEQIEVDKDAAPGLYFLKLSSESYNKTISFVKQ